MHRRRSPTAEEVLRDGSPSSKRRMTYPSPKSLTKELKTTTRRRRSPQKSMTSLIAAGPAWTRWRPTAPQSHRIVSSCSLVSDGNETRTTAEAAPETAEQNERCAEQLFSANRFLLACDIRTSSVRVRHTHGKGWQRGRGSSGL